MPDAVRMTSACPADALARHLVDTLEADGVLSPDVALNVRQQYLDQPAGLPGHAELCTSCCKTSAMAKLSRKLLGMMSFANFAKVVAILCLLVAAMAGIVLITPILASIPVEVFQVPLLILALVGSIWPDLYWESQSAYIAVLSVFLACIGCGWVFATHEALPRLWSKLDNAGWPVFVIVTGAAMFVFGALAVRHQSQLLGLAAAMCYSGIMGFGFYYFPHTLMMYVWRDSLSVVVYGHMVIIVAYIACKHLLFFPAVIKVFAVGIEYYCTIAMGVGFLLATSPWDFEEKLHLGYKLGTLLVFVATLSAFMCVYFLLGTKAIGSILCVHAVFIFLEYYYYFCSYGGFVFTMAAMAVALYGCAMLLEKHGRNLLVFSLTPADSLESTPLLEGASV
jgi:hypothetical protein